MLKNIRHTGLVVRDLSNSRKFYEALGFAAKKHALESGPEISRIVGIPNVEIETLKLGSPDGSLIELKPTWLLPHCTHGQISPRLLRKNL